MGETALADTGTNAVHCKAVQHGDGLYVVEFVPLVRGEFLVNVTARSGAFGGRKLGNLPGSVVVQVDSAPNPIPKPKPNPNPNPNPNRVVVQVDSAPVATCMQHRNCTGHGQCNYNTGRCVCDAGWDGLDCGQGASRRRKCLNDCSGHGYCSDVTDGTGRNVCRYP